jgi:hypothetical protein
MPRSRSFLFLFVFALWVALAHEYPATLTGRVIDAQGTVIPKVDIMIVNQNTHAEFPTVSGRDGVYTVTFFNTRTVYRERTRAGV